MPAFVRRHRVLLLHLSFWGACCSFYFYRLHQEYGVRQALLLMGEPLLGNVLLAYFTYGYLLPMHMPRRTGTELPGSLLRPPLVVFTTAHSEYALPNPFFAASWKTLFTLT